MAHTHTLPHAAARTGRTIALQTVPKPAAVAIPTGAKAAAVPAAAADGLSAEALRSKQVEPGPPLSGHAPSEEPMPLVPVTDDMPAWLKLA